LDVKTLIEKKRVCRTWRGTCTEAMDAKQTSATRNIFSTNQELCHAVEKYFGYNFRTGWHSQRNPQEAKEFAQTYGYPINKWDVSTVQDLSYVFHDVHTFNEDISSWNVFHASTMAKMFFGARAFHQDLSSWNVQNVTN
jgi:surface protein